MCKFMLWVMIGVGIMAEPGYGMFTIPIKAKGDSTGYSLAHTLYFGTAPGATNGFDTGVDSTAPPVPPSGFYAAFYIGGTVGYLYKDIRSDTATHLIWQLRTRNADGIIDSMSWNPADFPTTGTFLFDTAGLNLKWIVIFITLRQAQWIVLEILSFSLGFRNVVPLLI